MSQASDWQINNDAYLKAALSWLRLKLRWLAQEQRKSREPSPGDCEPPEKAGDGASEAQTVTEKELSEAKSIMDYYETDPAPALIILGRLLELSRFEREAFLLCAAMELDTRIPVLCAQAQDDPGRPYPTFALILALFDNPAWDIMSPERPLRYWRLVEIVQAAAQPLATCPLRADERMVSYIKGLNYLDDRLAPLILPMRAAWDGSIPLPPSQQAHVDDIRGHLKPGEDPPIIQLLGTDMASKQQVAGRAASSLGLHLFRLSAELLPAQTADLETLARLWQRECKLLKVALYLDAHDAERSAAEGQMTLISRFLEGNCGLVFLDTRDISSEKGGGLNAGAVLLEISKPTNSEQRDAWISALGQENSALAARLACQFNLNLEAIGQIAHLAQEEMVGLSLEERVWDTCLMHTRPNLDVLARRIDAKATWDDIVLPTAEAGLLHQISDQVRNRCKVYHDWGFQSKMNRGLGISALFAGESGTGKTMAAEVLANDLGLSLYRIDLSAVVSKYIGETEKNLRRLFDAAEDGGAILLFDEADALFGKRSEVKDSHDRYANIEINYLLQRIEAYTGLAILATNMKSALDPAFMRRIRFLVNFLFPGIEEREKIWKRAFPSETPLSDLDYDRLAKFNITGGSIHNIALNAAFLAAQEYLFCWDEVPGKDTEKLQEFLIGKFGIQWIKASKIDKVDNGMTITANSEAKSLLIKLNDERTEAILEIEFVSIHNIALNAALLAAEEYLLNWDEIPGKDTERLQEYFIEKFGIQWVKAAKVDKIDDGKTIRISSRGNSLLMRLNQERTELNLEICSIISDTLIAKTEKGLMNIYAQKNSPVTMPFILKAARIEFKKLERAIKDEEFKWQPGGLK
jgi:SpoVK/Ycf46/Vps4 family AAA+-type ATPase